METSRPAISRQKADACGPLMLSTTTPVTVKTYNYLKTQHAQNAPALQDPYRKDPVQWTETRAKKPEIGHTVIHDDPSQMVYRYKYSKNTETKPKYVKP